MLKHRLLYSFLFSLIPAILFSQAPINDNSWGTPVWVDDFSTYTNINPYTNINADTYCKNKSFWVLRLGESNTKPHHNPVNICH